jgi:hypothetical protein
MSTFLHALFHVLSWSVLLTTCRNELELLITGSNMGLKHIPTTQMTMVHLRKEKRLAFVFIIQCLCVYAAASLVLHGYSHAYHEEHMTLRARRTAARARPAPFGCTSFGSTWDQLTWMQTIQHHTSSSATTDKSCTEWISEVTMDVTPSHIDALSNMMCRFITQPLTRMARGIGMALQSLADVLSSSMQVYVLLVLPGILLVAVPSLLFFIPWISVSKQCANFMQRRVLIRTTTPRIEEVETEYKMLRGDV